MKITQSNITPFLWFNGNVEEALNFYTSIFKNSKIIEAHHLPGDVPGRKGKVFTATFELDGQKFMALDGGPQFKFSPATSFFCQLYHSGRSRPFMGKTIGRWHP